MKYKKKKKICKKKKKNGLNLLKIACCLPNEAIYTPVMNNGNLLIFSACVAQYMPRNNLAV